MSCPNLIVYFFWSQ